MNKVYVLTPRNSDSYDVYEGFVVLAPNKEVAIKLASKEIYYKDVQLPFESIEEVDINGNLEFYCRHIVMDNYCIYCEYRGDTFFCGMYCVNGDAYKPRERIIKVRFTDINEVHEFLSIVDSCNGDVWLESREGDKFNLKSPLSQYVAIGALLSNHSEDLELYCGDREDEAMFFEFFESNPEAL